MQSHPVTPPYLQRAHSCNTSLIGVAIALIASPLSIAIVSLHTVTASDVMHITVYTISHIHVYYNDSIYNICAIQNIQPHMYQDVCC
nr:MAG TPA: hypothetical protein [Caudoviricetes sp.]